MAISMSIRVLVHPQASVVVVVNLQTLKLIRVALEGLLFTYGYDGDLSWVMPNADCDYTTLGKAWTVATDIDISSNQKFKIFAVNQTDPNAITTRTSPGFLLLPSPVPSTLSSVSTAASYSGSGILPATHITGASTAASTSLATPGPKSSDLSSGATAGIGVSCTLVACFILLGAFLFFMRRRRQQRAYRIGPFSLRKPELDGRAAAEKHELDEQHGISEMMEARITTPAELSGNGNESNRIVGGD